MRQSENEILYITNSLKKASARCDHIPTLPSSFLSIFTLYTRKNDIFVRLPIYYIVPSTSSLRQVNKLKGVCPPPPLPLQLFTECHYTCDVIYDVQLIASLQEKHEINEIIQNVSKFI